MEVNTSFESVDYRRYGRQLSGRLFIFFTDMLTLME